MKWIQLISICTLALVGVSTALAEPDEDEAESTEPDEDEATPSPGGDELDLLEGTVSTAPTPPPLFEAESAPTAPAAANATLEPAAVDAVAAALVGAALDRLAAVQVLLSTVDGVVDREAALAELQDARESLRAALVEVGRLQADANLKEWLKDEGLVAVDAPAEELVVEAVPAGLARDRFAALLAAVEAVSFSEGKMQVLSRDLGDDRVTSEQASRLVQLFNFSRDRVDALVFLHPRIVDPENFDGLLSSLKFESDRETVRNQLGLDG